MGNCNADQDAPPRWAYAGGFLRDAAGVHGPFFVGKNKDELAEVLNDYERACCDLVQAVEELTEHVEEIGQRAQQVRT